MQRSEPVAPQRRILRVLVVEDEPDTAETQRQLVEVLGFEAQLCPDAATALRVYPEYRPDVLLLDIGLPDMNGYELAGKLLKEPNMKRPLLVALTGHRPR